MNVRLYTLRYKTSRIQGVVEGDLEVAAQDDPTKELAEAKAKGEWFCAKEPNRKFVGVVNRIIVKLHEGPGTKAIEPPTLEGELAKAAKTDKKAPVKG